jgi:zinc protease
MAQDSRAEFLAAAERASRDSGQKLKLTGSFHYSEHLQAGRFLLPNGLKVVLARNNLAPIFAYQTWFKVGSKHEDPQRTGLAHLFEHLMFKGTANHPSGEFDHEMERRGSQTNAATWVDWTYYTEALAARDENLSTVMAFEADRMAHLEFDLETFTSELEVVKNERRMSVDDSVIGTLGESMMELAYQKHPYRWPTIGSMAHLQAATLDDLRQFYRQNYAPNNATVVICGAVELYPTLMLLVEHYGKLAPQPLLRQPLPVEPPQRAPQRRQIERQVQAPHLLVGYHAPSQAEEAFLAGEVLGELLASGDTARLYRRLVTETELTSEVSASMSPFAEPGLFEVYMAARAGVDPEAILGCLDQILEGLQEGIEPFEMHKAKNSLELGQLEGLRSVEGCAEAMGHYETNFEDFSRAFRLTEAYAQVTPEQVQALARQMFRPENRSVVVAVPQAEASP